MNKLLIVLLSLLFISNVLSYNILVVFPYPGKSHAILGEGYVRHLLNAGHEVTYVTSILAKPHPKLKQIDTSSNVAGFEEDVKVLNFETFLKEGNVLNPAALYNMMLNINNKSITHENIQKFLMESNDKYDLVIAEWLYSELYAGFPVLFNAPFIWALSLEPHPAILSLIDEPQNPAYFPDHMSGLVPPLTFTERVYELWSLVELYFTRRSVRDRDEAIFRATYGPAAAKRGITLPPLDEIKYKSAMVFGNSHYSSGEAHKLPQNYVAISGYHIEEKIKPLPENWQKIMDEATNGVIYFSMGTMMKSKTLPQKLKKELLQVFSELKETVIWKFEENLEGLPKNVHIVQWSPQQSILAHPNCKLFITHGGLLSTTETLHFGVPIIGIPLFVDQHVNVIRAVKKGFGLKVDLGYDLPSRLREAIKEVLSNPKYREMVKSRSFIYHHRPTTPGSAIVHWSEHVIQTKGAPHLQSPAFNVPLYQKFYLDLVGLIAAGVFILVTILKKIKLLLFGSSKKTEQKNKKKYN